LIIVAIVKIQLYTSVWRHLRDRESAVATG